MPHPHRPFYGIVDAFHIVPVVGKEGAFVQRNRLIRDREDFSGNGGFDDIAQRGQLIQRQDGDVDHQHIAFITPVELILPFIVLVGGRVDAAGTIRVASCVDFLGELVLCKGFGVVLLCVCRDWSRVHANEGAVHDLQLVQLPH